MQSSKLHIACSNAAAAVQQFDTEQASMFPCRQERKGAAWRTEHCSTNHSFSQTAHVSAPCYLSCRPGGGAGAQCCARPAAAALVLDSLFRNTRMFAACPASHEVLLCAACCCASVADMLLCHMFAACPAGHEVLLVGGAVRDLLLQRGEPKDYDILTSAQLKQVRGLCNIACKNTCNSTCNSTCTVLTSGRQVM